MRGRGQVTIFFALGLVLLIAAGIIYVMLTRVQESEAAHAIDITANPALNNYVTACLDTIVNDQLAELGRTGGLSLIDPAQQVQYPYREIKIDGVYVRVLYGITQNRRDITRGDLIPEPGSEDRNIDFANITIYCREGHKLPDLPPDCFKLPNFLDGYFGQVNLLPLCEKNGSNGPGSSVLCTSYPGTPPTSIGSSVELPSIEGMLREKIQQKVATCISPQQFRETVGQGFVAAGTPNVNVKFTETNMLVNLTYNLTLEGSTKSSLLQVDQRYPVRILPFLEYTLALAREETRNVSFNIGSPFDFRDRQRLPYLDGFNVTRRTADVTASPPEAGGVNPSMSFIVNGVDIVTVTDNRSVVNGKPMSLTFLIEHRPPMIEALRSRACTAERGRDPDDGAVSVKSDPGSPLCQMADEDGMTYSRTS